MMPASLLDPDYQFGASPLPGASGPPTDLLGLGQLQVTPPQDTSTDLGAGLAQTYQAVSDYISRQREQSRQLGLLGDNGLPTQKGVVEALRDTAQGVMMGTTAPGDVPPPGIVAYHGSPHSFDQFDTSKIGTGEGAQAYGHGLYFAGNEGVAQTYKFANQPAYMNTATANVAQDAYQQAVKSGATDPLAAARNSLWEQRNATDDPIARRRIDDAYNNIEQLTQPGGAGHMYQVNIGADPDSMLQWDQTVGQHPPALRDKLLDMGYGDTDRGADVYSHMARGPNGDVGASQRLQDAGIPGISYLDAGSRGVGTGTKNHVVFDANTIDILRKYGIAGLIAGGGAAATQRQGNQ